MIEEINLLKSVKDIEREIKTLQERERLITKPALIDFTYISELHDVFIEVTGEDTIIPNVRMKFIFIVIYLYCPKYLVIKSRRYRLRLSLSKIFNYITPAMITYNISSAIFQFWHYRDFRNSIIAIFDAMKEKIKEKDADLYEKLKKY